MSVVKQHCLSCFLSQGYWQGKQDGFIAATGRLAGGHANSRLEDEDKGAYANFLSWSFVIVLGFALATCLQHSTSPLAGRD